MGGAATGVLAANRAGLTFAQGTPVPEVVITPSDPQYDALRTGFNLRWVGSPASIALCSDAEQVRQTVQQAVDNGQRVTVRSGNHCYEDFAVGNDGGVIVDMSPMSAVGMDAESGQYFIEAGAQLLNVYTTLDQQYGVTLPGGSCATVGAGGHITGGGYGVMSRLYGLTVDYLDAVELVHVTREGRAEVITASRDSTDPDEQDLLWGHTGGGGGNFGIVTKFFFRELPPAPAEAYTVFHTFDFDSLGQAGFRRLVQNYGNFMAENSGVDSPFKGLFPGLAIPQAPGKIGLFGQYSGDQPELLEQYAQAVGAGVPAPSASTGMVRHRLYAQSSDISTVPWLEATKNISGVGPAQRAKYKSAYMLQPFPDEQIDVMWEFFVHPDNPNPQASIGIDGYGCQVNAVDSAATAVAQRSSILKLQYQTYWTDPADDDANLEWIRSFYAAMYGEQGPMPDALLDGCYVNYADVDLIDWPALYYKDGYARLQQVKARWDPLNIFNYAQSIRLPDGDGTAAPAD
jgi:FAD/FMN-containing dehydrogenase